MEQYHETASQATKISNRKEVQQGSGMKKGRRNVQRKNWIR